MNINLHIKNDFPAVYMLNGVFIESGRRIVIRRDEVTYVTVLPLSAALLPYTVKLAGGKARCNEELCRVFTLTENDLVMRLSPRYNYVYSPEPQNSSTERTYSPVPRFFTAVIAKDLQDARKFLTQGLASAIDVASLTEFFSDYDDIIANDGYVPAAPDSYFLIDKKGKATLFSFVLKDNLIDDIIERG